MLSKPTEEDTYAGGFWFFLGPAWGIPGVLLGVPWLKAFLGVPRRPKGRGGDRWGGLV